MGRRSCRAALTDSVVIAKADLRVARIVERKKNIFDRFCQWWIVGRTAGAAMGEDQTATEFTRQTRRARGSGLFFLDCIGAGLGLAWWFG